MKSLRHQVTVAVGLIISGNGQSVTIPLLVVTKLFFIAYLVRSFHSILAKDIFYLLQSFQMAASIYWNGMTIITKSLWWGVLG